MWLVSHRVFFTHSLGGEANSKLSVAFGGAPINVKHMLGLTLTAGSVFCYAFCYRFGHYAPILSPINIFYKLYLGWPF